AFSVELVDQPLLRVPGVLRDLFYERLVIQTMNGFELPVFCGNLEPQGRVRFLHSVLCALAPAILWPDGVLGGRSGVPTHRECYDDEPARPGSPQSTSQRRRPFRDRRKKARAAPACRPASPPG